MTALFGNDAENFWQAMQAIQKKKKTTLRMKMRNIWMMIAWPNDWQLGQRDYLLLFKGRVSAKNIPKYDLWEMKNIAALISAPHPLKNWCQILTIKLPQKQNRVFVVVFFQSDHYSHTYFLPRVIFKNENISDTLPFSVKHFHSQEKSFWWKKFKVLRLNFILKSEDKPILGMYLQLVWLEILMISTLISKCVFHASVIKGDKHKTTPN